MRDNKTQFRRASLGDGHLEDIDAACAAEPFEYPLQGRERAMGRVPDRCLSKAEQFDEGSPERAHWLIAASRAAHIYLLQRTDRIEGTACETGKRTPGGTLIPAGQRASIAEVRRFNH